MYFWICQSLSSTVIFSNTNINVQTGIFPTVISHLLYPVDCVGLDPRDHLPPPPELQNPLTAATTAKRSINPKKENPIIEALLASQQVQIKCLRTVVVELQSEIENVRTENRTLKQVSPSSLLLSLRCKSPPLHLCFMCFHQHIQGQMVNRGWPVRPS